MYILLNHNGLKTGKNVAKKRKSRGRGKACRVHQDVIQEEI